MQSYFQDTICHTIQGTKTRERDHAREDHGPDASKHRSPDVESNGIAHAHRRLSMCTHEWGVHVADKARTLSSTTKYATFASRNSICASEELSVNKRCLDVTDHSRSRCSCSHEWPSVYSLWRRASLRQRSWPDPSHQRPTDQSTRREHSRTDLCWNCRIMILSGKWKPSLELIALAR